MSDFQKAIDSDYVIEKNGVELRFPPLKLKSIGTLLEKIRNDFTTRLEKIAARQKLTPVQTAEFMKASAVPDYGPDHIFSWVWSWDGAIAIFRESLSTSGKKFDEIEKIMNDFSPEEIVVTALEIIRHDARPSNRQALEKALEVEKKTPEPSPSE